MINPALSTAREQNTMTKGYSAKGPRWHKEDGDWSFEEKKGKTAAQWICKDTVFYDDHRRGPLSGEHIPLVDRYTDLFDKVPYIKKCRCGNIVSRYVVQESCAYADFMCDSCESKRSETTEVTGTVCRYYEDIFTAVPDGTPYARSRRNEILKQVRKAKGFNRYVTAGIAKDFLTQSQITVI